MARSLMSPTSYRTAPRRAIDTTRLAAVLEQHPNISPTSYPTAPPRAIAREVGLTLDYTPGCSFYRGAKVMQIGIVAKRIGLSVDAIRFYERNGLLPRPPRTQGGFRRYGENDVETLAFIRRVQGLGFKLSEIRGLLRLRGNRLQPCAPVQRRLEEKLADVQRKLNDLHKLEHELRLALRSCNKELRKRDAHCPILRETNNSKPENVK